MALLHCYLLLGLLCHRGNAAIVLAIRPQRQLPGLYISSSYRS